MNLRGRITAFDALTGKKLWHLSTIPGPGEAGHETWPSFNEVWKFGGGGVWTNAAIDPKLGLAYFTTGNPMPAFSGDSRPGNNLYTCSVLAVDIRTGALRWHYQLVHHDVFEADLGTPVVLYDANIRGKIQKAIAILRSDGHLFQLDRLTGTPLQPIEERSVPQLKSQKETSLTQPFPARGESILMSCEEWKNVKLPAGFQLGCMFTIPAALPPSSDPQNVLAPFPSVRLSPMAYSPRTRYLYAQGMSFLTWPRLSSDPYIMVYDRTALDLNSYGHLAAIDSLTGRIAWKRRIYVRNNVYHYLKGGLLTTAGDLLFRGSGDGHLESYDARTGEVLWRFQTGSLDTNGSPVSYELDGQQYVALPMGDRVWAFSLAGKLPQAAPVVAARDEDMFTGRILDANQIEAISLTQQAYGAGTRSFVDEFRFSPTRARVTAGKKVAFINNGSLRHDMTALDGTWGTGPLSPAQRTWLVFDKPGRYTYICKEHPWTYGQLIVESPQRMDASRGTPSASLVDQIGNGRQGYGSHCGACHGEQLEGQSMIPALAGATFASHWTRRTIADLFDRVRTTMPPVAPGSLGAQQYLDIVAYLLHSNNAAPRKLLLTNDLDELKGMSIGVAAGGSEH